MCTKKEEMKKINEKISKLNNFFKEYRRQKGVHLADEIPKINEEVEIIDLLSIAEKTRSALKMSGRELSALSFRQPKAIKETRKMFDFVIQNRKWRNPYLEVNLLLEWAIYRVCWAIGGRIPQDYGPILNWDGSEPIHTASGLQPDILVDFESYYLIVESTISSGTRQYDTETEPVIRHIARVIKERKDKGDARSVYSLFVARELDPNTIEYFYVYYSLHKHPLAQDYITVIPLTVSQFSLVYENLVKADLPKDIILSVFNEIERTKSLEVCKECGVSHLDTNRWYKQVLETITRHGLLDQ